MSLVQSLRNIDSAFEGLSGSEYDDVHSRLHLERIEEHRADNRLIDRTIRRETSVCGEIHRFNEKYGGIKHFYPNFIDREDEEVAEMLKDILGDQQLPPLDDVNRFILNPIGFTAMLEGVILLGNKKVLSDLMYTPTRRYLLKLITLAGVLGSVIMGSASSLPSLLEECGLEDTARYVDNIIQQVYHS